MRFFPSSLLQWYFIVSGAILPRLSTKLKRKAFCGREEDLPLDERLSLLDTNDQNEKVADSCLTWILLPGE